jgi:two-component system invasion response regulator UvrY
MHVLVVEDNPLLQKLVPAVLEKALGEVQVSAARTLEEAFQLLAHQSQPAFVLLDLGLPGHDGVETLRRFRLKFPHLPVVVFSITEDEATVRAARRLGVSGYIPKRLHAGQMVEALKQVVAGGSFFPS